MVLSSAIAEEVRYVDTNLGSQKIHIVPAKETPTEIIVFLHGDSAFRPPTYQYDIARRITDIKKTAIAIAILRPGYEDGLGGKSDGRKTNRMGDNYTEDVLESMNIIISGLKAEYNLPVVLFGHSGGAALSALMMNRYPDLSKTALLAACPCDLDNWRKHQFERSGRDRWISDMPGLSPSDEVGDIAEGSRIHMLYGSKDNVTPLKAMNDYVENLEIRKIYHEVTLLIESSSKGTNNFGHDMILDQTILSSFLNSY
ncbi:alpha/beta hydrolase [Pseudemcibacter aquimaris]|uniref:alpha/beta hydrolase n=1 Tax=Pseudemcibacter aquimaris TaxID=2857064 RepID=UPI002012AC71|nr:lysophospholipase [Pseudemcibacter aquimaris]MCC3859839.1 alpha/beta hydrolase [Pseudemcibacter aquimaris]WDU57171.1 lysophospholipase [Pseudemcibacter aquimaris]